MAITSTVPNIFVNGEGNIMDADEVIANFDHIISDVNANATALSEPIIGALPFRNLIEGEVTDANKVMANFEFVRSQVNGRAVSLDDPIISAFPHTIKNNVTNDADQVNENFQHLVDEINSKVVQGVFLAAVHGSEAGVPSGDWNLQRIQWDGVNLFFKESPTLVENTTGSFAGVTALDANTVVTVGNIQSDLMRALRFNGSVWDVIASLDIGTNWPSVIKIDANTVAVVSGLQRDIKVFKLDEGGGTFNQIGNTADLNSFSSGEYAGFNPGLEQIGTNEVILSGLFYNPPAPSSTALSRMINLSWDGSDFSEVGTFSPVGEQTPSKGANNQNLAAMRPDLVAHTYTNGYEDIAVYQRTGNSWNQVGNTLVNPAGGPPLGMCALSEDKIMTFATSVSPGSGINVWEWNGSDFIRLSSVSLDNDYGDACLTTL